MWHGSRHLLSDYSDLPNLICPEKWCFDFNQTDP